MHKHTHAEVDAVVDAEVEAEAEAVVDAVVDAEAEVEAEVEAVVDAKVVSEVESDVDAGLGLTVAVSSVSSTLRLVPPSMLIIVRPGGRESLNNAVASCSWLILLRPAKLSCTAKPYSSSLL
jgi:hypothetical protein